MARSDWLTGQPLEREGPNPIAGFLAGLMQAQAAKQQRDAEERKVQQEWALKQIQDGRTMLEKAAQMDPALWGDTGFVDAWKTGKVEYLASNGWKPPVQEQPVDYEKASKQAAWQRYQEGTATEKDLALIGLAPKDAGKPIVVYEGAALLDPKTGKPIYERKREYGPAGGGGGGTPRPTKTRWGVRQILMEDGKSHLVQYDIDDPTNKSKWYDLGLAGGVSMNSSGNTFNGVIAEYLSNPPEGDDDDEKKDPELDEEDSLFFREVKKILGK
jgi:hypothetical protein